MLSPLTSPPRVITQEEHDASTSSTPRIFERNPPILRFHDTTVSASLESNAGGWEGWNGRVEGALWVTEAAVSFLPANGQTGWTLVYPSLTLHALTPTTPDLPAHIYCQVDESDAKPTSDGSVVDGGITGVNGYGNGNRNGNGVGSGTTGDNGAEDEDEDEEAPGGDEYTPMREVRLFVSEDKLQGLFSALSQCSALHLSQIPADQSNSFFGFGSMGDGPDDDEDDVEDDDEEGGWEDVAQGEDGGEGGRDHSVTRRQMHDATELEAGQDQVDRFLGLVDWGHVQKPHGWDDENGAFEDAEEESPRVEQQK